MHLLIPVLLLGQPQPSTWLLFTFPRFLFAEPIAIAVPLFECAYATKSIIMRSSFSTAHSPTSISSVAPARVFSLYLRAPLYTFPHSAFNA